MIRKFYVYELKLDGCTSTEMVETFRNRAFRRAVTPREFGPVALARNGIALSRENIYVGYLYLVQMKALPLQANQRTGEMSDLFRDDDLGLRHTATFLIDTELNVLVFESLHFGPSEKCFCEIVENAKPGVICDLPFVLNRNSQAKFNRMTDFKSVEIEIIKAETNEMIQGLRNRSLSNLINSVVPLEYRKLSVTIAAEVGNSYLDPTALMNFARAALRLERNVKKIRIKGRRGHDEKLEAVDLLVDRKLFKINIELERNESQQYIIRKQELLLERYLEGRDEVRELVAVRRRRN